MRTIFDTCEPRQDVLSGALPESQFAADLYAVVKGAEHAPLLYRDARTFFEYTYPTRGLQQLAREVFGRFAGLPGTNPCLRLETSMGGGKTHNLIALWHLGRHPAQAAARAGEWLEPSLLPREPLDVVALLGDKYSGAEVDRHGDLVTRTLWGEMAWQLGRYEVMRSADERLLAPSNAQLEDLLRGRRVLVLMDELPRYLRAAKGVRVGAGTLADQTLVFFHLLLVHASTHDNLVVVYTLAERDEAYGREREEIIEQLHEARGVSARQERVVTPIGEDEIAQVIRRRLFLYVDEGTAAEVAAAYTEHLRRIRSQGTPLPPEVEDPGYVDRIRASYPFHPELLETLYRKTSSNPEFQWARGTLRIMAATVRTLWHDRPRDAYLIHSCDVDLSHSVVRDELTSRIGRPRLVSAIAEDIWSEHGNAHAQLFDRDWEAKGFPGLSRRVAQAVFLHSLVHHAAPGSAGAEPAEVHLACARPGLPFDVVEKALQQIDERFFWAEFDGRRYVFRDEPTVKKLVESAVASVGLISAKDAVRNKAREVFSGPLFELKAFPNGPEDVPDRVGKPLLVLLDFDHQTVDPMIDQVPAVVREIFERTGETRGFRNYQNNLVVLVADASKKEDMIEAARRAKAVEQVREAEEQRRRLSRESMQKLDNMYRDAQLQYRVAVTNGYCHLYYRGLDGGITHCELPIQDSADARRTSQQEVLREVLVRQRKVLTGELDPNWVLERVWPEAAGGEAKIELRLEELLDRFARRPRAYLILDAEGLQGLRRTVRRGVEEGVWVYAAGGRVYRKDQPPSLTDVWFEGDAALLTPALAEERFPRKVAPQPGPLSGSEETDQSSGTQPAGVKDRPARQWGDLRSGVAEESLEVEADGPAPKALATVRDRLRDAGVSGSELEELHLSVGGAEGTLRLLEAWNAVTNALLGATIAVEHTFEAPGVDAQELRVSFRGPEREFADFVRSWLRSVLQRVPRDALVTTRVLVFFQQACSLEEPRFDQLAHDLEDTYRCSPLGVKVICRRR